MFHFSNEIHILFLNIDTKSIHTAVIISQNITQSHIHFILPFFFHSFLILAYMCNDLLTTKLWKLSELIGPFETIELINITATHQIKSHFFSKLPHKLWSTITNVFNTVCAHCIKISRMFKFSKCNWKKKLRWGEHRFFVLRVNCLKAYCAHDLWIINNHVNMRHVQNSMRMHCKSFDEFGTRIFVSCNNIITIKRIRRRKCTSENNYKFKLH